VKAIVRDASALGIPIETSLSAGSFVCNHVLVHAGAWADAHGRRAGFIHVPWAAGQAPGGEPELPLERIVRALEVAIRTSLPLVPDLMAESTKKASQLSSGSINRVEAALLRHRVGERFPAIVLEVFDGKARIQLTDPLVTASCRVAPDVAAGTTITVTCTAADIVTGTVAFDS
jgi:hypothetical protein